MPEYAWGVVQIIAARISGFPLGMLNSASHTILLLIAIARSLMALPVIRRAVSRVEITEWEPVRSSPDLSGVFKPAATH